MPEEALVMRAVRLVVGILVFLCRCSMVGNRHAWATGRPRKAGFEFVGCAPKCAPSREINDHRVATGVRTLVRTLLAKGCYGAIDVKTLPIVAGLGA